MKQYSRVTYAQRCQISALMQAKTPVSKIATIIGVHKSTVYRELKRNKTSRSFYKWEYEPLKAHIEARKRFLDNCRRKFKVCGKIEENVVRGLRLGWSPELIAGRLKREKKIQITHQTIYRYIKFNSSYKFYLLHKGWRYPHKKGNQRTKVSWAKSIHERPKVCNRRKRIGDWERDTMYAKDKAPILVCTDRKSRYTRMDKLNSIKASEVLIKTRELLESTGKTVHTLTNDNGVEFRSYQNPGYTTYFCDPMRPQQRGTVENTIGVIRRFIKNDTDISDMELEKIEHWLNLRPRKVLDYKTPYEVFYNEKVALAI